MQTEYELNFRAPILVINHKMEATICTLSKVVIAFLMKLNVSLLKSHNKKTEIRLVGFYSIWDIL